MASVWRQLPNGRVVHRFEWTIAVLALLVIPVVLIEESNLGGAWDTVTRAANWTIWAGFATEFAFVLSVAPRRRAALRAHWLDATIVVVTIPLLPSLLAFLRLARLLRLVRLLRLATLGVRALAAERLVTSRQGFRYVALATGLLIVVAGVAVSVADAEKFPNPWLGLWWAITTVTTVGYGDIVPTTVAGRTIASVLMLLCIGFISMLTAAIASTFVAQDVRAEEHESESEQAGILRALERIDDRLSALETRLGAPGR